MSFPFFPTRIYPALTQVDPEELSSRGIRLLMLDFDNTIVPYTTNEPTAEMAAWLERAKASSVQLCVVSNSKRTRVVDFCRARDIDCITHAKKPFHRGIHACLERYGAAPSEAALCGDQIYTDVMGANTAGMTSLLVQAIDNHNFWLKLRHAAELPWILMVHNRRVSR